MPGKAKMAAPCIDLFSQIESEIFQWVHSLRSYQFLCSSAFIFHHNSIWLKYLFVENGVSEMLHKMNWNCAFEHIHIHSLPPVSHHQLVNAAVPIPHTISPSVTAATRSSDDNGRSGGFHWDAKSSYLLFSSYSLAAEDHGSVLDLHSANSQKS